MNKEKQIATLRYFYNEEGEEKEVKYKTYNFEEVYKFKGICKKLEVKHAVNFTWTSENTKEEYIVNKKNNKSNNNPFKNIVEWLSK